MERRLRVGGGIIDVSHLKPRFASRTNEPEIAEKFSKRFLTRPCGRSNSRARRKRVVTIGGDRVLSAGWKTMGFDEPCQLTASTYADRYLGQRDYFFRRGRGRCSANSVQFERIPIIRLVIYEYSTYTDDSRTKVIYIIALRGKIKGHAFDDWNSNGAAPFVHCGAAGRRGQTEKWNYGRI